MKLHLNLAEWGFTGNLTDGQPLVERLERLGANGLANRSQAQ